MLFFPEDYFDSRSSAPAIMSWSSSREYCSKECDFFTTENDGDFYSPENDLSNYLASSSTNEENDKQTIFNQNSKATGLGQARSSRRRAIITAVKASEIFLLRSSSQRPKIEDLSRRAGDSVAISRIYGISPKAVRDIWNR